MSTITTALLKSQLDGLTNRYTAYHTTTHWLLGKLDTIPAHLLPPTEGEEGERVLSRLGRQTNSLGPRVLSIKRNGTIGDITWGGEDPRADEIIRATNLDQLANRLFERLFGHSIAAVVAHETPDGTKILSRLGGYLEPVLDPYDVDVVLGLLQVQAEATGQAQGVKYRVRLWDTSDPDSTVLHDWKDVTDPGTIRVDEEGTPDAPTPFWQILQTGPDGLPYGEFQQALPVVQAEWASQVRGDRVEESTAFPIMKIKGNPAGIERRGPTRVIEVDLNGDVAYLLPGDLTQMHLHHDRKLERLRDDLSLPGGGLGGQTPSGEALREANQKFIASCRTYATALSSLLTQGVADLLALHGISTPVPINVDVNREAEKGVQVSFITSLYQAGLIPLEAAVRGIAVYIPTWSDQEVEEYIAEQTRVITPDDLRAALNADATAS